MNVKTMAMAILMGVGFCGEMNAQEADWKAIQARPEYSATAIKGPQYPGGLNAFRMAIHNGIQMSPRVPKGKYDVTIDFVVGLDGKISEVKVIRDPGYGIGQRVAKFVLSNKFEKWTPAETNGEPSLINNIITVPIYVRHH